MNEEQLVSMWRYLSETPPVRILQVILEAFLQAQLNQDLFQVDHNILLEDIIKSRGDHLLNPGIRKERRM